MKKFINYIKTRQLRESQEIENTTENAVLNLFQNLQNTTQEDQVREILAEHPEFAKKLHDLTKQALLSATNLNYYGM